MSSALPTAQGLYDPRYEHDSCGVGFIVDLKGRDIRVNVLSPGYTATPGLAHFLTDQQQAEAVASVPLGRIGTPDDLGKAAVFLASDDSAYVNGIELFVDGGAAQI